jgi:hypothetical protein
MQTRARSLRRLLASTTAIFEGRALLHADPDRIRTAWDTKHDKRESSQESDVTAPWVMRGAQDRRFAAFLADALGAGYGFYDAYRTAMESYEGSKVCPG